MHQGGNGGSILDNSLISYGSNSSDGDLHNHEQPAATARGKVAARRHRRHLRCDGGR